MKICSLSRGNWLMMTFGFIVLSLVAALTMGSQRPARYVAHEWGTFTSVQGSDGVLLDWRPLESVDLPTFVYDWSRPGRQRQPSVQFTGKAALVTQQRMETPVIYFYADTEQSVDVTVEFPQGLITEWYPQADQVGPASVVANPLMSRLNDYARKAGVPASFNFASLFSSAATKDSRARWRNVEILPRHPANKGGQALPTDTSGSHYFAARDTDANAIRVQAPGSTSKSHEHEKFIFYRGVGSFPTPLRVTMPSHDELVLENSGREGLSHLYMLRVEKGKGHFIYVDMLRPGERKSVTPGPEWPETPLEEVAAKIQKQMAASLVQEGLFEREAEAMVQTWQASWFQEDGLRVLYVLPREWTDRTLPLKLDPVPQNLVRVMVGRAEVLSPAIQDRLEGLLSRAAQGDEHCAQSAEGELRRLGRFAEPALRLATQHTSQEVRDTAWRVFHAALQTERKPGGDRQQAQL